MWSLRCCFFICSSARPRSYLANVINYFINNQQFLVHFLSCGMWNLSFILLDVLSHGGLFLSTPLLFRWMQFLEELLPQQRSWLITIREMVIFPFLIFLCYFFVLPIFRNFNCKQCIYVILELQPEIYCLYLIGSFIVQPCKAMRGWDIKW